MPSVQTNQIIRPTQNGRQERHELPALEPRRKAIDESTEGRSGRMERLKEEISLFREMFEQLLLLRLTASERAEEQARRVWTPRSEEPLEGLGPRPLTRVRVVRGRIEFACPACQRHTELAASQEGQKARCQLCHSAIIVPREGREERGRNMERDVESLLHPERFHALPVQGLAGLRRKHFRQARILLTLSLVLGLLLLSGYRKLMGGRTEPMGSELVQATITIPDGPQAAAEAIVKRYLAADGIGAKSAFVRDPARVRPLMENYFARHPGSIPMVWKSIQVLGTGFYAGSELTYPITNVSVDTVSGNHFDFTVEHTEQGPLIEWESSLGYSPQEWPAVLAAKTKSASMRVLAALDDYYNFDFTDERAQMCVRLQDPENNELLGYGYLDRQQAAAVELRELLEYASPDAPRPVVIEVAANERSTSTKQVRIVKVVSDGWRTATPTMASAR